MNRYYMFRPKAAIIKSTPDISNPKYTEYNAFSHSVTLNIFESKCFYFRPNDSLALAFVHRYNDDDDDDDDDDNITYNFIQYIT